MRGQASLTDVSRVSNSCLRRKSPTRKTSGVCAIACDQRHLRRPERSPLHDVRQHARRCLVGHRTCEFVFSRTRCDRDDRRTGGARRDRTDDLLLAKQALSQLSYGPAGTAPKQKREMVGLGRFELPTSRLSSARSNQLSYRPIESARSPQPSKTAGNRAPTTLG